MSDTRPKIVVVGAGPHTSTTWTNALLEIARDVVYIENVSSSVQGHHIQAVSRGPDMKEDAWYKKFAGKRGKAPRY